MCIKRYLDETTLQRCETRSSPMMRSLRLLPRLRWLLLLSVVGCQGGEPLSQVAGRVTIGGEPVTTGGIEFEDRAAGISAGTALNADGSYEIRRLGKRGLPPGDYRVAVRPLPRPSDEGRLVGDGRPVPRPSASAIPEKYHRTETSGLKITVVGGDNGLFDFDLSP